MKPSQFFTIRKATLEDAESIATITTLSWQSTYQGIIENSFLESLQVQEQIPRAQKRIQNPQIDNWVVEDASSKQVVGFAATGKNREKNIDADFELYAIYLLQEFQGQGLGKMLFQKSIETLKGRSAKRLMVSVIQGNQLGIGFYEKMGGKLIGTDHVDLADRRYQTATYLFLP